MYFNFSRFTRAALYSRSHLLPAIVVLSCSLAFSSAGAQGNLQIIPKRIVFEKTDRYGELTLVNNGRDTARYDISLVHYRMKEDGSLQELQGQDSAIRFADAYIRFFPRSVVLAPNESQVVRVQCTRSAGLAAGEYRSHLYFRSVSTEKPLGMPEEKPAGPASISIQLKPVFGISVPVIVRTGESTTRVGLSNCSFEKTSAPAVKMMLTRQGNMSFYGDITVEHIAVSGTVTKVAEVKGIAVYTPLEARQISIPLNTKAGVDYTTGKLHIVYQAPENTNHDTIVQTELYLN